METDTNDIASIFQIEPTTISDNLKNLAVPQKSVVLIRNFATCSWMHSTNNLLNTEIGTAFELEFTTIKDEKEAFWIAPVEMEEVRFEIKLTLIFYSHS